MGERHRINYQREKEYEGKVNVIVGQSDVEKKFIIETINEQLKGISYLEYARHCSINGFMINILAALIAYCLKEEKHALDLNADEIKLMDGLTIVVA